MIQPISLTDEEKRIVKQHYVKTRCRLIRERAHCILLSHQGRGTKDISQILMRKQETVRYWISAFSITRIASIFPAYTDNSNAAKLTKEQKQEIQETLAKPPHEAGLPGSFWSVVSLKEYVAAAYSVIYESKRSYHYLFSVSGYSFKRPSPFDKKRDDAFVKKRMEEIRDEIKPCLQSDDWIVLAADETRVSFRN